MKMQATCCDMMKSLTAGNNPACWEFVPESGWCIPNNDGYQYAAYGLLYCPYCGARLPNPDEKGKVINVAS